MFEDIPSSFFEELQDGLEFGDQCRALVQSLVSISRPWNWSSQHAGTTLAGDCIGIGIVVGSRLPCPNRIEVFASSLIACLISHRFCQFVLPCPRRWLLVGLFCRSTESAFAFERGSWFLLLESFGVGETLPSIAHFVPAVIPTWKVSSTFCSNIMQYLFKELFACCRFWLILARHLRSSFAMPSMPWPDRVWRRFWICCRLCCRRTGLAYDMLLTHDLLWCCENPAQSIIRFIRSSTMIINECYMIAMQKAILNRVPLYVLSPLYFLQRSEGPRESRRRIFTGEGRWD